MHDLNLACRYADHLIAMAGGVVAAQGAPSEVVTRELVRQVFGLEALVVDDPVSRTPTVVPIGRHHRADPHRTDHRSTENHRTDPATGTRSE